MYYELSISFDGKNYDSICTLLYLNRISSILEEYNILKVYFKLSEKNKIELIKDRLINKLKIPASSILITKLPDHDWNKEWKATIEPVYIKNKIIIYPSWKRKDVVREKNKILIEIDPKMSFGTGHNGTTQLILEMMCDYTSNKDEYLLDYGCGTAILAIAGIKLGIGKAVAIDIDKDSILNAKECIKNNNVTRRIVLLQSDIKKIKEHGFDVIVCNIDKTIIIKNLKYIRSKLVQNGKLFLTGILKEDKDEIIEIVEKNKFSILDIRKKTEWVAFFLNKK